MRMATGRITSSTPSTRGLRREWHRASSCLMESESANKTAPPRLDSAHGAGPGERDGAEMDDGDDVGALLFEFELEIHVAAVLALEKQPILFVDVLERSDLASFVAGAQAVEEGDLLGDGL